MSCLPRYSFNAEVTFRQVYLLVKNVDFNFWEQNKVMIKNKEMIIAMGSGCGQR